MHKAQIDRLRQNAAVQVKGFTKGAKTFNCLPH